LKTGIDSGSITEVSIEGQAGSLHGHFHKSTAAAHTGKTVLFLSGSGSSAEDLSVDIAGKYCNEGVDVLCVNYRRFGKSHGVPSEEGLLRDAESMLDFLVKQKGIAPENVIVHGYSLGGPIAAHVAKMIRMFGTSAGRSGPGSSDGQRVQEREGAWRSPPQTLGANPEGDSRQLQRQ
jgi:RTX toxin RtxA